MIQFVRFEKIDDRAEIAVFSFGGLDDEFRLNQENLAIRITNLKKQKLDTTIEECVLFDLRKRNEGR